jgi:hypothetical protein
MNLLAIVLYNARGERRVVRFRPRRLNIVTGESQRGKSALLDIAEFCLGRTKVTMPIGPITRSVVWYAVLLQLPGGQVFIARPSPGPGVASTQRAMITLGAEITIPALADLVVNADADSLRDHLSGLIGIDENLHVPDEPAGRRPLAAHIGHAMFLCLQGQSEIGNRNLLFHRQGEQGIAQTIKDTLPYFLGAVPADQAIKRQQLTTARRELRRLEAELRTAERANEDVDVEAAALLNEAYTVGLIDTPAAGGREASLAALRAARQRAVVAGDEEEQDDRQRSMQERRRQLRETLRDIGDQRALLGQQDDGERSYQRAAQGGAARLQSIDLISSDGEEIAGVCPVCASALTEPDPTAGELRQSLEQLRGQLRSVDAARPRRAAALADLDNRATAARQELRAIDAALASVRGADAQNDVDQRTVRAQAFTQGRVDLYLARLSRAEQDALGRLRERVALARRTVASLEAELDPDNEREQITSRLMIISQDMTRWADRLQLEHAGTSVRLDLRQLTVVADTDDGPAPLSRIGSAANWVGYHLVAHLALHRHFVRSSRPVPHLLMIDQPTQAYFPSDVEKISGVPIRDEDREAVRRLYRLMYDVASDLAPGLQIIVCDHANLEDGWFQQSVDHNWRGDDRSADADDRLIPETWIDHTAHDD